MIARLLLPDRRLIGQPLTDDRWRGAIAVSVALLALALDFWIVWRVDQGLHLRAIPPAVAILTYLWLAHGDWRSVGLRLAPEPRLRFWAWMLAAAALFVTLMVAAALAYVYYQLRSKEESALPLLDPEYFWPRFVYACVLYPVLEEAIFRGALCTPLAPVIGAWPTIILSGATFAAMHFLYGNAGLDNFVAGYFLAWSYLRSGSILVPIAFHSVGNLLILFGQMAAWRWVMLG